MEMMETVLFLYRNCQGVVRWGWGGVEGVWSA